MTPSSAYRVVWVREAWRLRLSTNIWRWNRKRWHRSKSNGKNYRKLLYKFLRTHDAAAAAIPLTHFHAAPSVYGVLSWLDARRLRLLYPDVLSRFGRLDVPR